MKTMLTKFFLATIMLTLLFSGVQAVDYTGYFTIDTVKAAPGDHFPVNVYLHENNVDFAGFLLPIRYTGEFLELDSVSFEGTFKPDNMSGFPYDFEGRDLLQVSYVPPFPVVDASVIDGLYVTLWFTLSETAPPGLLPLDSASIDTSYSIGPNTFQSWFGATMADAGGTTYFPDCISGGVDVLTPTGIDDKVDQNLPNSFALDQNYPNPFNPSTIIKYSVPMAGHVKLEVFNILGQSAMVLTDREMSPGNYEAEFDASAYPSGIFFYRLSQADLSITKKMVLIK